MAYAHVIVDLPLAAPLDYLIDRAIEPGSLCVVPLGRRRQVGIVVGSSVSSALPQDRLRSVGEALHPGLRLSSHWLELTRFAAAYYHYSWGELALPALPPALRRLPAGRRRAVRSASAPPPGAAQAAAPGAGAARAPELRPEQRAAIAAIGAARGFAAFLLFGITGSGKTEVYLHCVQALLARDPTAQALVLVPEINLTPQLQARLAARFPAQTIVSLHSGLSPAERARSWLLAHRGEARIVLGTRTAVFASLPGLRLLVVDEEHDASFKAHGGVPFSARDLAVKRAQIEGIPVVLGSATPALETWRKAQEGHYALLRLTERPGIATLAPVVQAIDLRHFPADQGLSAPLRTALEETLVAGGQSLLFINRRGYAPVLRCAACEWLSQCPRCDVYAAYHKVGGSLRCHHCGWNIRVPAACPACGNQDLQGVGQGTQRLEESLRRLWPQARIARIDRDVAQGVRGASRAHQAFDAVHAGEVDILVGTQMITKGHDFQNVNTVGVLNADAQLVAPDFRAPERLFAVLMQVAGRAGRAGQPSRVLIQTRFPAHPLFAALGGSNFPEFAHTQLQERHASHMPPYSHQALLTCTARDLDAAIEFLGRCVHLGATLAGAEAVTLYDPVPMPIARIAAESRAQLLVESGRRAALHRFLAGWIPEVRALGARGILRWGVEVDPSEI